MHYCCIVFTKEFPTDAVLAGMLAPFNEEDFYEQPEETRQRPAMLWDWYSVGGRYHGGLKLEIRDNDPVYKWEFYAREPRTGRLFRSKLLEKMKELSSRAPHFYDSEEDYYRAMGSRDGFLYVDGAPILDVKDPESIGSYWAISSSGEAISRESWNGDKFIDDPDYDEKFKKLINDAKERGEYICIVDTHD